MASHYNCYALLPDGTPVFDRKGNPDLERGELYVSVSTILSVEGAGDFLTKWALSKFKGYQCKKRQKFIEPIEEYDEYMSRISSLGTRLHRFMECDLTGIKYDGIWDEAMEPGADSWADFRTAHNIKLIDAEKVLHSKKLRIAGTRDLKIEIDGELYIADLKTGSVYPKAFVQLAIYSQMGYELGEKDNKDAKLLVLGGADSKNKVSDGGPIMMHFMEDHFGKEVTQEDLFSIFMCLRQVWYINNLKSRKFKPVIKGMAESLDPMIERFKQQFHN